MMFGKIFVVLVLFKTLLLSQEARTVIQSLDRTILSSEIGGNIVYISKRDGDYFKKGETLIKIECNVYEAQKRKIQTKRDLLAMKVEKNIQLQKYNSVGQFEIQTAKLELKEQEMELKIADINVKRCEIKAPYSGRVVQKLVNKYQNVKPQDQLLEIVNSNLLEAKMVVPANWINYLKIDDELSIHIDELNKTVKAKIKQLDSVIDPKSQTMNIRAQIEQDKDMIPGMSGTAIFNINPTVE